MSNDDHSTVIFLMPFFLFMCNVGMCVSFSILLLFLIMASLGQRHILMFQVLFSRMGDDNVEENRTWHARGGRKKKGRRI